MPFYTSLSPAGGGENPIQVAFGRQQEGRFQNAQIREAEKMRRQQLALGIASLLLGGGQVGASSQSPWWSHG